MAYSGEMSPRCLVMLALRVQWTSIAGDIAEPLASGCKGQFRDGDCLPQRKDAIDEQLTLS